MFAAVALFLGCYSIARKRSFLNDAGTVETWEYQGGAFTATSSWAQGGARKAAELSVAISGVCERRYLFESNVIPIFSQNGKTYNFTQIIKSIKVRDKSNNKDFYKSDGSLRRFYIYGIGRQKTNTVIIGVRYETDSGEFETTGAVMFEETEANTNKSITVGNSGDFRFDFIIDTTAFYKDGVLEYMATNIPIEVTEINGNLIREFIERTNLTEINMNVVEINMNVVEINANMLDLSLKTANILSTKNLYNKSLQIAGDNGAENGYLNDVGEVIGHASAKTSYYIPIKAGKYFAQGMYGMSTRVAIYDKNRVLLRVLYKGNPSAAANDALSFLLNEEYVRFSIRDINTFMLSIGESMQEYEEYLEPYRPFTNKQVGDIKTIAKIEVNNMKFGVDKLNIVSFGDSTVDGKTDSASDSTARVTWVETLAKAIDSPYVHLKQATANYTAGPFLNMPKYKVFNMGSSGMRITYKKDGSTVEEWTSSTNIGELGAKNTNNVLYNWLRRFEMLNTNSDGTRIIEPDIFLIAAGTNDISQGSDLGLITDAFDDTANYPNDLDTLDSKKMTAALKRVLLYMQINYPNTKICYCTPIHGGYGGRTLKALGQVSQLNTEICKRMNVLVIDLFNESGINGIFENPERIAAGCTRDTIDGVHPRKSGADKIAKRVLQRLKGTSL